MTRKSALYAVAVVVLMGSMAVAASAGDQGLNLYARADSAYWPASSHIESEAGAAVVREPMETGAVPEKTEGSSDMKSDSPGGEQTVEFGGLKYRPGDLN
jgi:hypothetical protein